MNISIAGLFISDADVPFTSDARVQRTATLDGGCVIQNNGVSKSDITLVATFQVTQSQYNVLESIYNSGGNVTVSIPDGCFLGVISRLENSQGNVTVTILIKSAY